MARLIILAALAIIAWKMFFGRWPWQPRLTARDKAIVRARQTLGVGPDASREQITAAHRRLIAVVHPDRGGSSDQVHEANAARDLLLNSAVIDESLL